MGDSLRRRFGLLGLRRWGGIGLAVVGGLVLTWLWSRTQTRADNVWARIQAQGVLTVATDASYPPFAAMDADGNLFGFDIDLAEAIGRRWGVRVDFENITYDALLPAIISNRDDAVISAFVPQPGRAREVSFTRAYFVSGTLAVVRAADAGRWPVTANGAWARGLTVTVEYGAGGDALVRQWTRQMGGIGVLPKATAGEALQAVADGTAPVALVDAISAYDFLLGHPALMVSGRPLDPEPYSIAVNAHSPQLFAALEVALAALEADGTLPDLRARWFGESARELNLETR